MRKRLSTAYRLLALCCGATCGAAAAGGEPQIVFRGLPHDALYAVSFEGRNGIAVGDFGLVVETSDGGKTWTRHANPPTDLALLTVVRRAGRCIAGGQQGLIITADDCRQWRPSRTTTTARILAVQVNAKGIAYAVGGFGTLLKSVDWGGTWQALRPEWQTLSSDGIEPHLYDVHVADDGEVTVVGELEMVMRSRDGGAYWNLLHKGRRSLFGLKVMDDEVIYAVGQEGLILKATEGGRRWTELDSGTQSVLTGIWASPDGQVVASGIYTILYSSDGGKSWQADRSKPAQAGWHQAIAGHEAGEGPDVVLVGSGGAILAVQR